WQLCRPHLEKITPAMKTKVRELTAGLTTPEQKIHAIFAFVANRIRYMGITTEKEAPGYEPHDVDITFENKYGVCRDKAALLTALLREAGLKAYPVLFFSGEKKDAEVPNNYFNHAIVGVELAAGKYLLMDPTDETTKDLFPAYLSNMSYLVATPEGDTLHTSPIVPAEKNLVRIATTGEITPDGTLEAVTEIAFDGVNDGVYRGVFMNWSPEKRHDFFAARIRNIVPGARLNRVEVLPAELSDTGKPLRVKLSFSAAGFPLQRDGYMTFRLPWVGADFGLVNFVIGKAGLEKRRFPMKVFSTCGATETFKIILVGGGATVAALPQYRAINDSELSWDRSLSYTDGVLTGKSSFMIKTMEFSPAEYLRLREHLKAIEYSRRKMPIFTMSPERRADSLLLSRRVDFVLDPDGSFTRTETVRRKILNYAGQKRFSELKFTYNPCVSEVKVVRASVTDAAGTTRLADNKERNLMDAPWVGDAPRYPAEKILVVNLPGVGKDSVIEYTVTSRSKAAPFFSAVELFQSTEPREQQSITLTALPQMAARIAFNQNEAIAFSRKEQDGKVVLQWQTGRMTAIPDELQSPPLWSFAPAIFISNGDWTTYATAWNRALIQAAATAEQCGREAKKLVQGVTDRREMIRRICAFQAVKVRPAGPDFTTLPQSLLTPADRTLADGYGHSADRATVLYAMLQAVGFQPEFVFPAKYPPVPELLRRMTAFPQRLLFDTVWVRVKVAGEWLYLNYGNQYTEPGVLPADAVSGLMLASGRFEPIAVPEKLHNRMAVDNTIRLDAQGNAEIERTVTYYGSHQAEFNQRYSEMTPEQRRRFLQNETAAISQAAVLKHHDIAAAAYPGRIRLTATVPKFAVRDDRYLYFSLPADMLQRLIRIGDENR
ncbi:MAG: DUF3857 domain-containing protein, partial [Victivallales bacterium]|nr:DUF3857 domain-containing protein [Victivallales bacterium]